LIRHSSKPRLRGFFVGLPEIYSDEVRSIAAIEDALTDQTKATISVRIALGDGNGA
jgi:hypothetical protein